MEKTNRPSPRADFYSEKEDNLIREMCEKGIHTKEMGAYLPGRSVKSIRNRCNHLNVEPGRPARSWTPKEIDTLRKALLELVPTDQIMKMLPRRTCHGMYFIARKMEMKNASILYSTVERMRAKVREQKDRVPDNTRNCMACGRKFVSWGPGNRLCDEHRRASTGMDL